MNNHDDRRQASRGMHRTVAHRQKILRMVTILAVFCVILAGIMLLRYSADSARSRSTASQLQAQTVSASEKGEPAAQDEEPAVSPSPINPLPDTLHVPSADVLREQAPISVDMNTLLEKNPDVVCWLYGADTPINLPVMQSEDNYLYLYHDFDRVYNRFGTLFVDYACSGDFSDANTMIYGHDMADGTMFGTLEKYHRQDYYDTHPCLYLFTPDTVYKLELVAGYVHNSYSPLYILPADKTFYSLLTEEIIPSSTFQTDTVFSEESRFVTLSTCSDDYDNARFAVIGVLKELVPAA